MGEYAQRVSAGIAFLRERRASMLLSTNLHKLQISNAGCCMLGQEFGDFSVGCEELGITTAQRAAELGFLAREGSPREEEYVELDAEWRRQLPLVRIAA